MRGGGRGKVEPPNTIAADPFFGRRRNAVRKLRELPDSGNLLLLGFRQKGMMQWMFEAARIQESMNEEAAHLAGQSSPQTR